MADQTKPDKGWVEREAERHPMGLVALVHMLKTRGLGETLGWMALSDPGFMPEALVMRGPNAVANAIKVSKRAAQIYKELGEDPEIWGKLASKPLKEAVAYMRAKYPKLSGLIGEWTQREGEKAAAEFSPKVAWGKRGVPPKGRVSFMGDLDKFGPAPRVEQAGHELTHAVQHAKGESFASYAPSRIQEGSLSRAPTAKEFEAYWTQPVEVQARQGGKTARTTYEEYQRLLGLTGGER